MSKAFEISRAIEVVRAKQSHGKLRKESGAALGSLLTWLAASGVVLLEQVPEEWSIVALALGGLVGVANVYVARFTEPAVTAAQQKRIVREAYKLEGLEAVQDSVNLPVYDDDSTADAVANPLDYEGRHRAVGDAD